MRRTIQFKVTPTDECRIFTIIRAGAAMEVHEPCEFSSPLIAVYREKPLFRSNRPSAMSVPSMSYYMAGYPGDRHMATMKHRLGVAELGEYPWGNLNPIRTSLHGDYYDISPTEVILRRNGDTFIS